MLWIISMAFAQVPEWPQAREPVEEQCEIAYAVEIGVSLPPDLSTGGVGNCGAVCFPTSDAASLIDVEAYAEQLRELYQADMVELTTENNRLQSIIDEPTPLLETQKASRWIGRAEGAAVGILVGVVGWQIYELQIQ